METYKPKSPISLGEHANGRILQFFASDLMDVENLPRMSPDCAPGSSCVIMTDDGTLYYYALRHNGVWTEATG